MGIWARKAAFNKVLQQLGCLLNFRFFLSIRSRIADKDTLRSVTRELGVNHEAMARDTHCLEADLSLCCVLERLALGWRSSLVQR